MSLEPRPVVVTPVAQGSSEVVEPAAARAAARGELVGEVSRTPEGAVRVEVVVLGWRFEFDVEDAGRARLRERATRARAGTAGGGPLEVRAIIPGRIVSVAVAAGDRVSAGQPLLVVEAMKMQNELRAPHEGTVERVTVGPGENVELGDVLVVLG